MAELEGKIAVITGAGSGMAHASAAVFVREGARVLAADITGHEEETAEQLGDAVIPFRVDVTDKAQVAAMFAKALDEFGRVDAVLNVAGIAGAQGPLAEVTKEALRPHHGRRPARRHARRPARHQRHDPDRRRRHRQLVVDRGAQRLDGCRPASTRPPRPA